MTDTTAETTGREYYPLRWADVAAIVLFWLFLAFLSAAGRELDPRIPGVPPRIVESVLRATYIEYAWWALITGPIWWFATRYSVEGGRRYGRMLLFLIGGLVIAMLTDRMLAEIRTALIDAARDDARGGRRRGGRGGAPLLGLGFLDDLMVYFAVLGSGVARDYFMRYRARLEETARLRGQLAQARLDALRSQLNPHFLFNTLNAVSALVERDPRGVRRMIARLSDLLRYTLDESTEQEVTLDRELDLLGEYVELMQIRFQGKLTVDIHVSDDVRRALVPNLILQPIVENAIKHGVGQITTSGIIRIEAQRNGDDLIVTITDNGPGPAGGAEGVGLRNTNERLRAMYGDAYRAELHAAAGGGTEAVVRMPYHDVAERKP
jgi:two-component sensor histidine kinase